MSEEKKESFPPKSLFSLPAYSPPPKDLPAAPSAGFDFYELYALSRRKMDTATPAFGIFLRVDLDHRDKVMRACGYDPKVRYSASKSLKELTGEIPSDLFEQPPYAPINAKLFKPKVPGSVDPAVDVNASAAAAASAASAASASVVEHGKADATQRLIDKPRSSFRRAFDDIVGGTIGGIALVLVGHPLDTLKVRLQTQPHPPIYKGMVHCFQTTIQTEGFKGLYKGVASPLAGQAVFNAWQFFVYGATQRIYAPHDAKPGDRLSISQYFKIGMATGFFVAFVEAPQDLFKSQMQVQVFKEKPLFTTVSGAVKHIAKEGGIRGMYQGLGATIVRNVPSVSFYFGFYEMTRNALTPTGGRVEDLPASKLLLAGGVGGVLYWGVNYPCDVIKSAMQGDSTNRSQRKYPTVVETAKKLYAEGGWKRFFRGYAPCLIRSVPANAVCFYFYEKTKEFLAAY